MKQKKKTKNQNKTLQLKDRKPNKTKISKQPDTVLTEPTILLANVILNVINPFLTVSLNHKRVNVIDSKKNVFKPRVIRKEF